MCKSNPRPQDRGKMKADELNLLISVFVLTWAVVEAVNLVARFYAHT